MATTTKNTKVTNSKASKATQTIAELDNLKNLANIASKATEQPTTTSNAPIIITEKTQKAIDDMEAQVSQYDEKLITKATQKKIDYIKSVKIPADAKEKTINEYDTKQAERIQEIYTILSDIDDKLEAAKQKEEEAAKYAAYDKLTAKIHKSLDDYTNAHNPDTFKKLALRQASNTLSIKQYLEFITNGTYNIQPLEQRGFVWNGEQVKNLLDSLLKGYAIPSLMVLNGDIIDGLQRTTAIQHIVTNLTNSASPLLNDVLNAHITINTITIDNCDVNTKCTQFERLNSGTAISKAVLSRNKASSDSKANIFAVKKLFKLLSENSMKAGVNLEKSGQLEGLAMYTLATQKADKCITLDPKSLPAIIDSQSFSDEDMKNISSVVNIMNTVINEIVTLTTQGKFKANIFNQNTISSMLYAIMKLSATAPQIITNIQKVYTNTTGDASRNAVSSWSNTTKSGGTGSSNIHIRAKMLAK